MIPTSPYGPTGALDLWEARETHLAGEIDEARRNLRRAAHLLSLSMLVDGDVSRIAPYRDELDRLGVPPVRALDAEDEWRSQERLDALTHLAVQDHGASDHAEWRLGEPPSLPDLDALWRRVAATLDPLATLSLVNLELWSSSEVVAAAAGAGLLGITRGDSRVVVDRLEGLLEADSALARSIAAAALGLSSDSPPVMAEELRPLDIGADDHETSVLVHGTWARMTDRGWYRPGSRLHTLVRADALSNLFSGSDYFRWTGGYTEHERRTAADDFPAWKAKQGIDLVDTLVAHSHGGNVALSRIAAGERVRLLVLLHTPVTPRTPDEWREIRRNVGRVLVLRSRADLTMLADGFRTGSTMRPPPDLPHRQVLPHWKGNDAWFSHGLFTNANTWSRYDIAGEVRYEHMMAGGLVR